jgi:hypothetical protein
MLNAILPRLPDEIIGEILSYNSEDFLSNFYLSKSLMDYAIKFWNLGQNLNILQVLIMTENLDKLITFMHFHPDFNPSRELPLCPIGKNVRKYSLIPVKSYNSKMCLYGELKHKPSIVSPVVFAIKYHRINVTKIFFERMTKILTPLILSQDVVNLITSIMKYISRIVGLEREQIEEQCCQLFLGLEPVKKSRVECHDKIYDWVHEIYCSCHTYDNSCIRELMDDKGYNPYTLYVYGR